jgi:hypothetical protein
MCVFQAKKERLKFLPRDGMQVIADRYSFFVYSETDSINCI